MERRALALALPPHVTTELLARFPGGALEVQGTWEGTLEHLVVDDAEGLRHQSMVHLSTGAERLALYAAGAADTLRPGDRVRVRGVRIGDRLASGETTVLAVDAQATCSPTGVQRTIVLLVNFPGAPTPSLTPAAVRDMFFATSGRSLNGFWQESSYGATSAAGDVRGWYTLETTARRRWGPSAAAAR